ncbi:adenosine kinase [Blyttiomyces sp. JEL0837]|nr:adenosine kinase [Blyttiomyces sp. JEL0837]
MLDKYGLKANDAVLANDSQKAIYADLIANFKVEYVAGGAAQNTLRGAQWLLPPKSTIYIGCVGKDKEGETLKTVAAQDGLRTEYMIDETTPTGRCGVLITGHHRSLCTDLLAANNYKIEHLKKPEVWKLVEGAKFFYIGGYFLTVSPESANLIAKHAAEKDKVFMMNLSAPFIPQFFAKPLDELAPYWDVLFGNEAEAIAYSESHNLGLTDIPAIAQALANLPKHNTSRKRIVVITQGRHPTIVAIQAYYTASSTFDDPLVSVRGVPEITSQYMFLTLFPNIQSKINSITLSTTLVTSPVTPTVDGFTTTTTSRPVNGNGLSHRGKLTPTTLSPSTATATTTYGRELVGIDAIITITILPYIWNVPIRMVSWLEFDGDGKVLRHEDCWSVKDLVSGIFAVGVLYEWWRRFNGFFSSLVLGWMFAFVAYVSGEGQGIQGNGGGGSSGAGNVGRSSGSVDGRRGDKLKR